MGIKVYSVYKPTGDKFELDAEAIIRCCGGLPKTSEEFMQAALKWWHELDDKTARRSVMMGSRWMAATRFRSTTERMLGG